MTITIQPFIWNELSHLTSETSIDETDEKCLEEVRSVLERYGRISKFGMALLHKHFEVHEGEVLVEYPDSKNRTLLTQAFTEEQTKSMNLMPTIWRFDGGTGYGCSYCNRNHHD